jgi:hypothetical protein
MRVVMAVIFTVMTVLEELQVARIGVDRDEPAPLQLFIGVGVVKDLAVTGGDLYGPSARRC